MSLRKRFFAATYDKMIAKAEAGGLTAMRHDLLAQARGDVLETGSGTGLNLGHYTSAVTSLTLTEPDPHMLRKLQARVATQPSPTVVRNVKIVDAPAEDLPFEDASFDVVVATLVLCGVDDQAKALAEARRVLRPDGTLLFLEHVRDEDDKTGRHQDHMDWLNRAVVGCHCNRRTADAMTGAGFAIGSLEHTTLPHAPKFAQPSIVGTASLKADASVTP